MRRKRSARGFTLIELMVVMGIAATLVAITVPIARNMANSNKGMRCCSRLQRISQALKMYVLDEGTAPAYYPDLVNGTMVGEGLYALFYTGYLRGEDALHCPADQLHGRNTVEYPYSYMSVDPNAMFDPANPYGAYNQYKYLSCRGIRKGSLDPDVRRQLTPLPAAPSTSSVPVFSREWHPDDTTVVTWCEFHERSLKQVAEAWRVNQSDDPTP